jgi:hypothetical protein
LNDNRKIWRTPAYRVEREGQAHVLFWVILRSGLDPEKSFVTEHDLYQGGSTSKPVAEQMSHADALRRIAKIEREAEVKYPRVSDEAFKHPSVNWQREEMAPWREHPLYQQGMKDEVFQRLRAKKPPGFGPK